MWHKILFIFYLFQKCKNLKVNSLLIILRKIFALFTFIILNIIEKVLNKKENSGDILDIY